MMKSPVTGESSTGLQIGALARLTGVPVKTIRYYSDEGLLAPAGRTRARYRLYGAADRVRLEQIRVLRELGFGLGAVAQLLHRRADPHAVIAAQLAAIERERSHLGRAAAVLRAALAGADPAEAALRVGAVLKLSALQRAAALRASLAAPLHATAVDRVWLDRLLDAAFAEIPAELDDDQWAALVELVALATDPSFGAALAAQAEPFWRRARGFDAARWQRAWTGILRRGAALLAERGALDPRDPRVRRLGDAYLAMIARATGRRPDARTIRWILARADEHDPRAERFWELVAILHRRPPPPHAAIMRAIIASLRAR
jgi:DNA-binding transcriptional MerR regulator